MGTQQSPGDRYLISPVDILAEAQISQFNFPNLDPYAVPEPSSFVLLSIGLTVLTVDVLARISRLFRHDGTR